MGGQMKGDETKGITCVLWKGALVIGARDNSFHGYCNVDNEPFAHFNYVINRKNLIDMIHESEGLF